MTTIADLLDRINALDVSSESQYAIDETREQLAKRQQHQMLHGLNAKGEKIGEYKNPLYAEAKHRFNPLAGEGNVDLRLTGAFHKGIFVDVRTDTFVIESGDKKSGDLQERYGSDVFGLNEDTEPKYVKEDLEPVFLGNVRKALNLWVIMDV